MVMMIIAHVFVNLLEKVSKNNTKIYVKIEEQRRSQSVQWLCYGLGTRRIVVWFPRGTRYLSRLRSL